MNEIIPYDFSEIFLNFGVVFSDDSFLAELKTDSGIESWAAIPIESLKLKGINRKVRNVNKLTRILVWISNLIVNFHNVKPSKIAASCILTSRKLLGITPVWREELSALTTYQENELLPLDSELLSEISKMMKLSGLASITTLFPILK